MGSCATRRALSRLPAAPEGDLHLRHRQLLHGAGAWWPGLFTIRQHLPGCQRIWSRCGRGRGDFPSGRGGRGSPRSARRGSGPTDAEPGPRHGHAVPGQEQARQSPLPQTRRNLLGQMLLQEFFRERDVAGRIAGKREVIAPRAGVLDGAHCWPLGKVKREVVGHRGQSVAQLLVGRVFGAIRAQGGDGSPDNFRQPAARSARGRFTPSRVRIAARPSVEGREASSGPSGARRGSRPEQQRISTTSVAPTAGKRPARAKAPAQPLCARGTDSAEALTGTPLSGKGFGKRCTVDGARCTVYGAPPRRVRRCLAAGVVVPARSRPVSHGTDGGRSQGLLPGSLLRVVVAVDAPEVGHSDAVRRDWPAEDAS